MAIPHSFEIFQPQADIADDMHHLFICEGLVLVLLMVKMVRQQGLVAFDDQVKFHAVATQVLLFLVVDPLKGNQVLRIDLMPAFQPLAYFLNFVLVSRMKGDQVIPISTRLMDYCPPVKLKFLCFNHLELVLPVLGTTD